MTAILRDARFGLRLLRRNPGFTPVAVMTLALGIAATTAIFSVVYGLFFAPLPYHKADRLVMVWEYEQGDRAGASARSYTAWKRQATLVRRHQRLGRPQRQPRDRRSPGERQRRPRDARVSRHARLRASARARPHVSRGRGCRRPRQRRHPDLPAVEGQLRRRSRHRRTPGARGRRAPDRRRRAGGRACRSSTEQDLDAAGVHRGAAAVRQHVAAGDGPSEG